MNNSNGTAHKRHSVLSYQQIFKLSEWLKETRDNLEESKCTVAQVALMAEQIIGQRVTAANIYGVVTASGVKPWWTSRARQAKATEQSTEDKLRIIAREVVRILDNWNITPTDEILEIAKQ